VYHRSDALASIFCITGAIQPLVYTERLPAGESSKPKILHKTARQFAGFLYSFSADALLSRLSNLPSRIVSLDFAMADRTFRALKATGKSCTPSPGNAIACPADTGMGGRPVLASDRTDEGRGA